MPTQGPANDWLQLSEHYRQLSDDELIELARESSQLTDVARQILMQEISQRRLTIPDEEPAPAPIPLPNSDDEEDEYAEDRELVGLCDVWSRADALKLQAILVTAGIPFFIGPEKAQSVDAVTSNFGNGLDVQVMKIGFPYARQLMQHYEPADLPADAEVPENADLAIHCPKCHSDDVTFDEAGAQPEDTVTQKFQWTCNSCGHEWEDDGVET